MGKNFEAYAPVIKVDASLGLVFGWAIVCKTADQKYIDTQTDHIPEQSMLVESLDFMKNSRRAGEMHERTDAGEIVFAFPMTTELAKALNFDTHGQTGLLIGMQPDAAQLAKFESGELKGFSIGGARIEDVPVEEEVA